MVEYAVDPLIFAPLLIGFGALLVMVVLELFGGDQIETQQRLEDNARMLEALRRIERDSPESIVNGGDENLR